MLPRYSSLWIALVFSDLDLRLVQLLADGRFHSGSALGRLLGVSRAAVWQHIAQLKRAGLTVNAVSGRGYCLGSPIELLDRDLVRQQMEPDSLSLLAGIEIFPVLASTNSYLRSAVVPAEGVQACFAESQTAGRGRAGRHWVSPFASNLYLSIAWQFQYGTSKLAGLSLAVAVVLSRALKRLGLNGVGIKWPNDLYVDKRKIAGILVEASGETHGPCSVVIGIGLNIFMDEQHANTIDQPWTDLQRCGLMQSRNTVAAAVLSQLLLLTRDFDMHGFAAFAEEWHQLDLTRDQAVLIRDHDRILEGVARGVDAQGLLQLERDGRIESHASGDVSLRLQG